MDEDGRATRRPGHQDADSVGCGRAGGGRDARWSACILRRSRIEAVAPSTLAAGMATGYGVAKTPIARPRRSVHSGSAGRPSACRYTGAQ